MYKSIILNKIYHLWLQYIGNRFANLSFNIHHSTFIIILLAVNTQAQSPFEQNGFVEIEAENYANQTLTEKRKWEIMDDKSLNNQAHSAGKNKYLKCLPDTRVTHGDSLIKGENFSDKPGVLAVLQYKINFTTTGRYYVWVRSYSTGSEDNGLHVGLDGQWVESGQRMQWCEGKNKWTWASKQRTQKNHCGEPYKIYLDIQEPGEHTVLFSMREDGFVFDKFILTQEKDFDPNKTLKRAQIYIRDPFIYTDENTKIYYMFATANKYEYLPNAVNGVIVYVSKDLENWSMPKHVFKTPDNWWASTAHRVWAPEVHFYQGKYYLFATFTHPDKPLKASNPNAKACVRGTAIMVSDSIDGTYRTLSAAQTTPPDWMALDGTLFIENNKPYMVFCREWIQVGDGTMEMVALKKDLSGMEGKPKTMFKATAAPWVKQLEQVKPWNTNGYITDGPWFYKTKKGKLLMLWSSFGQEGYAVGVAESSNGKLSGKWTQKTRLFEKDGGHAMIFKTFEGKMMLTLHQPNSGDIRARFFELEEVDDQLKIGKAIQFNEASKSFMAKKEDPTYFEYQNPIVSGIDTNGLRDCQVLKDGDWWYMTGTSHPHWARQETNGNLNKGVVLYKSKNLTDWQFVKWIVERGDSTKWYYRRFWAPEIQKIKGKYYATFNCNNDLTGHIGQWFGYAVADKIDGPYKIITAEKPLGNGNDLTFYEDDDGKVWAFWNRGREFGIGFAQIDLDKGVFLTEPTSAIQPAKVDYEYDTNGAVVKVPGYDGRPVPKVAKYYDWDAIGIEGAYIIKRKDTYYLFYSSWTRGYEIGYATAPHITGPWTKAGNNPFYGAKSKQACEKNGFVWDGDAQSPFNQVGHNEIFVGPDNRFWLSCHGIRNPVGGKQEQPFLVIDPIDFDEAGRIISSKPSYQPQKISLPE